MNTEEIQYTPSSLLLEEDETFIAREEKSMCSFKTSKDRLTLRSLG
jgi:hypothetical protein